MGNWLNKLWHTYSRILIIPKKREGETLQVLRQAELQVYCSVKKKNKCRIYIVHVFPKEERNTKIHTHTFINIGHFQKDTQETLC